MRKIVASFFISLDGVVEAAHEWHFPYFNEEMAAIVGESIAASDAMLLGRITYQAFASFWPTVDPAQEPVAAYMNDTPKYLLSRTLDHADWKNTTLLTGDAATEIARLKEQSGKNIAVTGSATLVRFLLANDLLDELNLLVHPIVLGKGQRLFDEGLHQPLELVSAKTLSTGVLSLIYRPVSAK